MKEGEHVLRIFMQVKKSVESNDLGKLKELSDQTVHTASIDQDPDNIAVAVIIYSLGKVLERREYHKLKGWDVFLKLINSGIDRAIAALKQKDEKKFKNSLGIMRKAINKVSGKLKSYVQDVFRKAQINKASRVYEHGISMEKTASLLGITMFELANYAGEKKEISDVPLSKTKDVRARLKLAEEFFK